MLEKKYEIIQDAPPAMSMDEYINQSTVLYQEMINNPELDEKPFQVFFEENPAFLLGAVGGWCAPYAGALISQPRIGLDLTRVPDFLLLSYDSLSFRPVFIEIEKPSKQQFKNKSIPNALFNQALDQITEWKTIMDKHENREFFYQAFSIPERFRKMVLSPQYILIYGRRGEFDNDPFKRDKRFQMQKEDTDIVSFDRLRPIEGAQSLVTVRVSGGKYFVKHIPPTYTYGPIAAEHLKHLCGFKEQINNIKMISEERRSFLIDRYDYWEAFGKQDNRGLIHTTDKE